MSKTADDVRLFEQEQSMLDNAAQIATEAKYQAAGLLPHYLNLIEQYEKLLKLTQRTFRISDNQGKILQQHQSEIQNLLDNANQGFLTFGADLKVGRQYSAECLKLFGKKIGGFSILELLAEQNSEQSLIWAEAFHKVFSVFPDETGVVLKQLPAIARIGKLDVRVECKLIYRGFQAEEQPLIMMILTDITDRLKAEQEINFLSYHDKLTGLHNRAYVEKALGELEQSGVAPFSVIIIDMNGLKITNDVFGHEQGDRLLVSMAQVLKTSCRQTDIVARWGGDEFLVLLPGADSMSCDAVCERIAFSCQQTESRPIRLSAAVGSATRQGVPSEFSELFSVAENRMYSNKLEKSREVRARIIAEMEAQLHERCFESSGHNQRVRELTAKFADYCGIDSARTEMKPLDQLAALHDIGKVAVPCEILGKAGSLTATEWQSVKRHSEVGYRLAQSIGDSALAEVVLTVHERWDGHGYPNGLVGNQIPLLARLFAIVDVYDVLTHPRPYGSALDKDAALAEIAAGKGTQFDPALVGQFLRFFQSVDSSK